ncbi:MAG: RseA family anti-sigma factor [Myxococcota bacterium]
MSNENESKERFDEELSALHDGEADSQERAALEARAQAEPDVAARLALFAQLDDALRSLPEREAPADLGLRLSARLEGEAPAGSSTRSRAAQRAPLRARRRWLAGAGLAAAAALVLYWSLSAPAAREGESALPRLVAQEDSRTEAAVRAGADVRGVSEEEVGIALHYDTLANLEVIEQLEMLELLAALDAPGPRG